MYLYLWTVYVVELYVHGYLERDEREEIQTTFALAADVVVVVIVGN